MMNTLAGSAVDTPHPLSTLADIGIWRSELLCVATPRHAPLPPRRALLTGEVDTPPSTNTLLGRTETRMARTNAPAPPPPACARPQCFLPRTKSGTGWHPTTARRGSHIGTNQYGIGTTGGMTRPPGAAGAAAHSRAPGLPRRLDPRGCRPGREAATGPAAHPMGAHRTPRNEQVPPLYLAGAGTGRPSREVSPRQTGACEKYGRARGCEVRATVSGSGMALFNIETRGAALHHNSPQWNVPLGQACPP